MTGRAVQRAAGTAAGLAVMLGLAGQASAATSLIGAYDKYVGRNGFEIRLVDLGTGQNIALPAGVNTAADEIHPALSADGRFLVFTRTALSREANVVIPPRVRTLVMVDRTTGEARAPVTGEDPVGSGAMITPGPSGQDWLAYGLRPTIPVPNGSTERMVTAARLTRPTFTPSPADHLTAGVLAPALRSKSSDSSLLDIPHAALGRQGDDRTQAYTVVDYTTQAGGAQGINDLRTVFESSRRLTRADVAGGHPALRATDGVVAWHTFTEPGGLGFRQPGDIRTGDLDAGAVGFSKPAPAPINTDGDERMPAWSRDATKLAFVRAPEVGGRRKLLVYDATPGLQTIVNAGIDLGTPAPTAGLRQFHDEWGGLALATETRLTAVAVTCAAACLGSLTNLPLGQATLTPIVTTNQAVAPRSTIGIVLARVIGTRRLLGHTVPRIRALGRVPLGRAVRGTNTFRWNGKVAGRRLAPGQYLLTFRALTREGRVRSTSSTIRFRVTPAGRIVSPRVVRS